MQRIPYSRQNVSESDINFVVKVLKSKLITQGPMVQKFEREISKKTGGKYCASTNSATSALHISCLALGFKKNDILWTVPNTFVASSNCALLCGGKVDFVDINPITYNIDLNLLEKKLIRAKKVNKLPKIVVPVHFSGQPTEQDKINKLSKKYRFKIIEDASHSIGASYKGEKVGSCRWSDITVFSFHPVKIITTIEGGVAITKNKKIYDKLKLFRNHGITKQKKHFINKKKGNWHYEQHELGLNYRMSDVSAALGISQLKKLNKFVKERNRIANYYNRYIDKRYFITPKIQKKTISSFHLYVIKLKKKLKSKREKFYNYLKKNKIDINVHYIPVHLQPYYKKLGFRKNDFKNSEEYADSAISIPIFPGIKKKNQKLIISKINKFFK